MPGAASCPARNSIAAARADAASTADNAAGFSQGRMILSPRNTRFKG
jgi:hypothetical protein